MSGHGERRRHACTRIAGVAQSVAVSVGLIGIGCGGTVVTTVGHSIQILVGEVIGSRTDVHRIAGCI